MGEFRVHHVRFFEFTPKAIQGLAYEETKQKLAVSRSDGSIEVWSISDGWYQEKILVASEGHFAEALVWCGPRLFSAGLQGDLYEHDLLSLTIKASVSSNSGAIWCLAQNKAGTQIAAGTEEGCVVLFEVTDEGIQYHKALDKQEGRILSVAWHSAENLIITGGIDNIRIWSNKSGHAIQCLTLGRQEQNKETIVWALAVTSDFTIISGDSRGKTCFWNGKQGTLLKSFQSHKADILALALNKKGTCVFSSGIDPSLVQFEYIPAQTNSDWKMWVRSSVRNQHSHDVRAVAFIDNTVVTGGVDCQLIVNHLQAEKGIQKWKRIPPIPQVPLAYTAVEANMVMLRYTDYLELWRLGSTNKTSEKNGEILALRDNPVKLLQLRTRDGEGIVCCAISKCAKWITYSTGHRLRLFQVTIEKTEAVLDQISVNRISHLPAGVMAARCLALSPDGSRLISATCQGTIQVLQLDDELQPVVYHTFESPTDSVSGIHLMAVSSSGKYIATGDHSNNVNIYNLSKKTHVCSLPTYSCQPCAIGFRPSSHELAVAYCDQKVVEYNYSHKEYTAWSREVNKQWHPQWFRQNRKLTQILYHPRNRHQIFVRDEVSFYIIDKTQPLPEIHEPLFKKGFQKQEASEPAKHGFHMCNKFKYLLHLDILSDDFLLVVERPPLAIMDTLPGALKQKKFGT